MNFWTFQDYKVNQTQQLEKSLSRTQPKHQLPKQQQQESDAYRSYYNDDQSSGILPAPQPSPEPDNYKPYYAYEDQGNLPVPQPLPEPEPYNSPYSIYDDKGSLPEPEPYSPYLPTKQASQRPTTPSRPILPNPDPFNFERFDKRINPPPQRRPTIISPTPDPYSYELVNEPIPELIKYIIYVAKTDKCR